MDDLARGLQNTAAAKPAEGAVPRGLLISNDNTAPRENTRSENRKKLAEKMERFLQGVEVSSPECGKGKRKIRVSSFLSNSDLSDMEECFLMLSTHWKGSSAVLLSWDMRRRL
ncbi:UNVERIFIED_CONTAM: hypothetical protein FKN15_003705 [Acipenser sinensis]